MSCIMFLAVGFWLYTSQLCLYKIASSWCLWPKKKYCLFRNYFTWRFLFELPVAFCILFTRRGGFWVSRGVVVCVCMRKAGGGGMERGGLAWKMWLEGVRLFHLVMWCLFSFRGGFFTGGLVPFTWIYYFSHWGSWWIWISVSKFVCVRAPLCALTPARGAYVRACGTLVSVCKRATLSWLFQISLLRGSTERGSQEGEREREMER